MFFHKDIHKHHWLSSDDITRNLIDWETLTHARNRLQMNGTKEMPQKSTVKHQSQKLEQTCTENTKNEV